MCNENGKQLGGNMTLEQLKQQDKKHAQVIADYLIKRCEEDKCLEEKILTTEKTLKGCVEYCKQQAKKQAEDGVAIISDSEVYEWCVHYFLEDSLNCENSGEGKKKETKKKEPKKVETLFGEEIVEEKPKKVTISKPKKEVVKEIVAEQLSLFD